MSTAVKSRNASPDARVGKINMKLEVVTGHLEPRATNLIPWVERREVAPFSQPSRAKRSAETLNVGS